MKKETPNSFASWNESHFKVDPIVTEKKFINGFDSWIETHFEIVSAITERLLDENYQGIAYQINEEQGQGGLYELAEKLTDKFEEQTKGIDWGEVDYYFDKMETFLEEELK